MSRQVQALEDDGLARREPHPTDRRGWVVVIDDGGVTAVEALHRLAERIETFNVGYRSRAVTRRCPQDGAASSSASSRPFRWG
ncbi:hypothetical protein HC251_19640 [Iamia sp. SCSIO 61187]|uniref:hypothetical protein n=1 Tax=Iamia sp. SCSIO 61187 TaxID=2722752 RepID=UPI001C62B55E|nr:hypothetical protein HC251_19640 [Iamia sp. SCSIO 61187]